jgi:glycosyltransferase involved in cell wall biosynthesis
MLLVSLRYLIRHIVRHRCSTPRVPQKPNPSGFMSIQQNSVPTMRPVILMSTYNGARFLEQQLESILTQLPEGGKVVIRDDGSSDDSASIVQNVADPRIHLTRGANLGFARSFLELIGTAPIGADMYMLSDQDDVWLPGKIDRAWQFLEPASGGVGLYCSRAHLVDLNLQPMGLTPSRQAAKTLKTALLQNIATGCTVAMTPQLMQMCRAIRSPDLIGFHDWWLYVVATAFGKVFFDEQPTMLYRQHGRNVIGMGSGLQRYMNIARYLYRSNWLKIMNNQIWALRQNHWDGLSSAQREDIQQLQNPSGELDRAGILLSRQVLMPSAAEDALLRLLVLMDRRDTTATVNAPPP